MGDERTLRALSRLIGRDNRASWELDLRGLDLPHAAASIERMVEKSRFGTGKAVVVRLDAAAPGGGETLFLPIGRLLLDLMRRQLVSRLNPLSIEQGVGFYLELPGRKETRRAE